MSKNGPRLPVDANRRTIQIAFHPNQALAGIAISTLSGMTSVISNKNAIVRIVATKACFYKVVESSGNCALTDHYLPANVPYDVILRGNENRIAFCADSTLPTGSFYATERT